MFLFYANKMKHEGKFFSKVNDEVDFSMEPEVSSIVQHYQTSVDDVHLRQTWRQAVKAAAQAQRWPPTAEDAAVDANGSASPRQNSSTPVHRLAAPGFSSFV